ncbi:MAG TPA: ABC transporter C-terminal domain-containing protein [Armatimonadota bacterium]|nr:ABC transporter C-terminal domain-containing protein [Armatimonadota bacterium]
MERAISETEAHISEVSQLLGSPQVYADGERVRRLSLEYEDLTARLNTLYARYLEVAEARAAKD